MHTFEVDKDIEELYNRDDSDIKHVVYYDQKNGIWTKRKENSKNQEKKNTEEFKKDTGDVTNLTEDEEDTDLDEFNENHHITPQRDYGPTPAMLQIPLPMQGVIFLIF